MRKIILCSLIMFFMILCTFGSGCITNTDKPSSNDNVVSTPISNNNNNDAQNKLNNALEIAKNHDTNFVVKDGSLYSFKFAKYSGKPSIKFLIEFPNEKGFYTDTVILSKDDFRDVTNGIAINNNHFIIKSNPISENSVLFVSTPIVDDSYKIIGLVLYLTPSSYNEFINLLYKEVNS